SRPRAPAMAEEAPAKAPKKKAVRSKTDGPSLPKLIVAAVAESKERKGISLAAIKKVLATKKVDVAKSNKRINTAVTKMVTNGVLTQTKGTGASGSFKLAKKDASERCIILLSVSCSVFPVFLEAMRQRLLFH
uniref:H15 domain-containing protein n=1 Tax=Amphiprion percula TaxID=161767 RepID=A0A3P8SLV9_AMPPE